MSTIDHPASATSSHERRWAWGACLALIVLTVVAFSGTLRLHWTNWDDGEYIYGNPKVLEGDYRAILGSQAMDAYTPMVVAMFAWEWDKVKDLPTMEEKAWLFHFNNLWMHVVCVVLVFWVLRKLGLRTVWAFLGGLIFAVHPMHVESVAWIAERKDVLYGMFYLSAMLAYLRYRETDSMPLLALSMVLAALAMLSKVQAVALPLALLAIDWYQGRQWSWRVVLEKGGYFLGALVIGSVTLVLLERGGTLGFGADIGWVGRLVLGGRAYLVYVMKALVPMPLSHVYPSPTALTLGHWLAAAGAVGVLAGALALRRRSRATTFGVLFFTVHIMFMLQILSAGRTYLADRYTYIAYIGLIFAACMAAQALATRRARLQWPLVGLYGTVAVVFGALSMQRIPDWRDSGTLWTHAIAQYPQEFDFAYHSRAQYYISAGKTDLALADLNQAITTWPDFIDAYITRGVILYAQGHEAAAEQDFTSAIGLCERAGKVDSLSPLPMTLHNRALIYARSGRLAEALRDLNEALGISPHEVVLLRDRASIYLQQQQFALAIQDYTALIARLPNDAAAYDGRGTSRQAMGQHKEAIEDFNRAIQLAPNVGSTYYNRARSHAALLDRTAAMTDVVKAQSLGVAVDSAFAASLR